MLLLVGLLIIGIGIGVYATLNVRPFDSDAAGRKLPVTITAVNPSPRIGDQVSFLISAPSVKERDLYYLWVANKCSQDGTLVLAEYLPVEWTDITQRVGNSGPFTLWSTAEWTGGLVSCTTYVWKFPSSETPLKGASVTYLVSP